MVMFLLVKEMVNHIQNVAVIKSMINICVVCIICGFISNIGIVGEYLSSELTHIFGVFSTKNAYMYVCVCVFSPQHKCDRIK